MTRQLFATSLLLAACGSLPKTTTTTGGTTGSTTGTTTATTSGSTAGSTAGSTTGATTGSTAGTTAGGTTGDPIKLWHASFNERKIRGFNETRWGATPTTTEANADTTLDLAACGNATPNALVQDSVGNLIFTDDANGSVVLIAAEKLTAGGAITLASGDCQTLQTGLNDVIGVIVDGDGRSIFAAHHTGVSYIKHSAAGYAAGANIVASGAADVTFSGLLLDGNRLYAVNYGNFDNNASKVHVYLLDAGRTIATPQLTFNGSQGLYLPEGIAITGNRLWVASNTADNLISFSISDIDAKIASNLNTYQELDWELLNRDPESAALHCPGALLTDHLGNLWVNVQGASDKDADCGDPLTTRGNLYKFTPTQLNLTDMISVVPPTLQIQGVASVPGFGGMSFGH